MDGSVGMDMEPVAGTSQDSDVEQPGTSAVLSEAGTSEPVIQIVMQGADGLDGGGQLIQLNAGDDNVQYIQVTNENGEQQLLQLMPDGGAQLVQLTGLEDSALTEGQEGALSGLADGQAAHLPVLTDPDHGGLQVLSDNQEGPLDEFHNTQDVQNLSGLPDTQTGHLTFTSTQPTVTPMTLATQSGMVDTSGHITLSLPTETENTVPSSLAAVNVISPMVHDHAQYIFTQAPGHSDTEKVKDQELSDNSQVSAHTLWIKPEDDASNTNGLEDNTTQNDDGSVNINYADLNNSTATSLVQPTAPVEETGVSLATTTTTETTATRTAAASVDLTKPIELTSETIITVNNKKCVLSMDPDTHQLVAYPVLPGSTPGRKPRGRPRKIRVENSADDDDSKGDIKPKVEEDSVSLTTTKTPEKPSSAPTEQENNAAEGLLGLSEADGRRKSLRVRKRPRTLTEYEIGAIEGVEEVDVDAGAKTVVDDKDLVMGKTPSNSTASSAKASQGPPEKRSRGRPPKAPTTPNQVQNFLAHLGLPVKRGRGRPRRYPPPASQLKQMPTLIIPSSSGGPTVMMAPFQGLDVRNKKVNILPNPGPSSSADKMSVAPTVSTSVDQPPPIIIQNADGTQTHIMAMPSATTNNTTTPSTAGANPENFDVLASNIPEISGQQGLLATPEGSKPSTIIVTKVKGEPDEDKPVMVSSLPSTSSADLYRSLSSALEDSATEDTDKLPYIKIPEGAKTVMDTSDFSSDLGTVPDPGVKDEEEVKAEGEDKAPNEDDLEMLFENDRVVQEIPPDTDAAEETPDITEAAEAPEPEDISPSTSVSTDLNATVSGAATIIQVPQNLVSYLYNAKSDTPVQIGLKQTDIELKRLKCMKCGYQAYYSKQYQDHIAQTHPNETTKCKCCFFHSFDDEEMVTHFKEAHPKNICNVCNFMAEHGYVIKRHMMRHTAKGCRCSICDKVYKDRYILKMHIKMVHMPAEVLFECTTCGKKFTRKAHLKRHLRTHELEKPFKCPYCEYRGCERSDITKHLVIHEEPKYGCEVCGKFFRHIKNKELHLKRHKGQRDYKCGMCDFYGYTYTDIRKHIYRKHADAKIVCDKCGCMFRSETLLTDHMRTCTGSLVSLEQPTYTMLGVPSDEGTTIQIPMSVSGLEDDTMPVSLSDVQISEASISESQLVEHHIGGTTQMIQTVGAHGLVSTVSAESLVSAGEMIQLAGGSGDGSETTHIQISSTGEIIKVEGHDPTQLVEHDDTVQFVQGAELPEGVVELVEQAEGVEGGDLTHGTALPPGGSVGGLIQHGVEPNEHDDDDLEESDLEDEESEDEGQGHLEGGLDLVTDVANGNS